MLGYVPLYDINTSRQATTSVFWICRCYKASQTTLALVECCAKYAFYPQFSLGLGVWNGWGRISGPDCRASCGAGTPMGTPSPQEHDCKSNCMGQSSALCQISCSLPEWLHNLHTLRINTAGVPTLLTFRVVYFMVLYGTFETENDCEVTIPMWEQNIIIYYYY
jgi:hypothetical protein